MRFYKFLYDSAGPPAIFSHSLRQLPAVRHSGYIIIPVLNIRLHLWNMRAYPEKEILSQILLPELLLLKIQMRLFRNRIKSSLIQIGCFLIHKNQILLLRILMQNRKRGKSMDTFASRLRN